MMGGRAAEPACGKDRLLGSSSQGASVMAERSCRVRLDELRGGEDAAAAEITQEYTAALVAVARRQIGPRLAQRLDCTDHTTPDGHVHA